MNKITWKQLAQRIRTMTEEQQESNVIMFLIDSTKIVTATDFVSQWGEKSEKYVDMTEGNTDDLHPFLVID